jgi:hypothetical protein
LQQKLKKTIEDHTSMKISIDREIKTIEKTNLGDGYQNWCPSRPTLE